MAFSFKDLFHTIGTTSGVADQKVVGIDIGSASIKVIELERTERAITLRTYGELQLGPYAKKDLGEAVQLEPQGQTEALVDVIREASVTAQTGVLAMPLASSFVTVIPVTRTKKEDIASKIRVEARKYIPIPLNEVTLDWSELPALERKSNISEVLLAAVQNDALASFKQLMASVELNAPPSEIEVFSSLRALAPQSEGAVAIIDIGARTSKLYVSRNGMLERIHRVTIGGSNITSRIAELLSESFAAAESRKRGYAPDAPNAADVKRAVTGTLTPPFQEFKRIIDQYEVRLGEKLAGVVLSGGTACFAELPSFVQDALARPVIIADPFSRVAYPAFMQDTLAEIGPVFSVALGAALRSFES